MFISRCAAGAALVFAGAWSVAAMGDQGQPPRLKVLISVDMEGVAGAVTGEQLGPTGFEYRPISRVHDAGSAGGRQRGARRRRDGDRRRRRTRQRAEPAHRSVSHECPRHQVVAAPPGHGCGRGRQRRRAHLHRVSRGHEQHRGRPRAHVLEREPHPRSARTAPASQKDPGTRRLPATSTCRSS